MSPEIIQPLIVGGLLGFAFCMGLLFWACLIVGGRAERDAERMRERPLEPPARTYRFHVRVENYRRG
jgi:hypothetical protein